MPKFRIATPEPDPRITLVLRRTTTGEVGLYANEALVLGFSDCGILERYGVPEALHEQGLCINMAGQWALAGETKA